MTEQQTINIQDIYDLIIKHLKRKGYDAQETFKKNLLEILGNPDSSYHDKTCLFSEIPTLETKQKNLLEQIRKLEEKKKSLSSELKGDSGLESVVEKLRREKSSLEIRINGDVSSTNEDEKKGLRKVTVELEKFKCDLELEIDGNEESEDGGLKNVVENLRTAKASLEKEIYGDKSSENILLRTGLEKRKENLEKAINGDPQAQEEDKKNGLIKVRKNWAEKIDQLIKEHSIVEKFSGLRKESIDNKRCYYIFIFLAMVILLLSAYFAYNYGAGIIEDIKKIPNKESRDYFGIFLLKTPFALIIITFVSGGFIFISKLLAIIERINNQLRNISQISIIASQVDQRTIDLLKDNSDGSEEDEENLEEAEQNKKEKKLFYKLITNYLVNLSKNELELRERKNSQLKNLKELANIVDKLHPKSSI